MDEREKAVVYWPGITNDFQGCRENCNSYNLIAQSNPRLPHIEPFLLNLFSVIIFLSEGGIVL